MIIIYRRGFEGYLERTLECVKIHQDFDVLGHLNYVCKSPNSPTHEPGSTPVVLTGPETLEKTHV